MDMTDTQNSRPSVENVGPIAGEGIKDSLHWPGYLLIAVSLAALAFGLAALATGANPVAIACLAVFACASAFGVLWQVVEHRRVVRRASGSTPERPEDAAAL
jgi:hypothetical protein